MQWTPTILLLDGEGHERHRVTGFLPPEAFLSQLLLGLARDAFERQRWDDAERYYNEIADQFPTDEAAPEALYWMAVTRAKMLDKRALGQIARTLRERYPESDWTTRASVWIH